MKHVGGTFACLLVWAASAQAAPSCRIPGATTIARGEIAVLLSVPKPRGRVLLACIRRSGRKEYLDDDPRVPRLAGRWVTWETERRAGHRLVVHDLRTGSERLVVGRVAARALVLTRRGTVAWVQHRAGRARPLYANDTEAGGRLLDSGDVDPGSLRLVDRRLSWSSDGLTHSTLLR